MEKLLIKLFYWIICAAMVGCSSSPGLWLVDGITTRNAAFDYKRLHFKGSSPLKLEFLATNQQVKAFLYLDKFLWEGKLIHISLKIEDIFIEEWTQVYQGGMRLCLPYAITNPLIEALLASKKIQIMADEFKEEINPEDFAKAYQSFTHNQSNFLTFFKGPIS